MTQPATHAQLPALIAPITDPDGLGPRMRALLPKQRAFVRAMVMTGGGNHTRAATMAGYGGSNPESVRATAYRLAHSPMVLQAIREVADAEIRSNILVGTAVLVEIAQNPHHKDRLKAAQALLDRGGLIVAQQLNVNISDETSNGDVVDRIRILATQLGVDPSTLLGRAGHGIVKNAALPAPAAPAIDVEFEEVPSGSAGLEDLL